MNITLDRPFAATERGKRSSNEDYILPSSEELAGLAGRDQRLFMVCDGVGGAEKGEVASALACSSFQSYFDSYLDDDDPSEEFINKAVHYTESRFDEYIAQHPEAHGMATTVTLLYIGASGIIVAHIGDSRIYQFREGKMIYKTDDHSLVNSLLKLGKITQEEARVHPQKNVITRAIMGTEHSVVAEVDKISDIMQADRFLMCTDGVTECFSDNELAKVFSLGENPESIKNIIVELCTEKAKDNFSFYILPIQSVQKIAGYKQYLLSLFYSFA
ncbi:MAG: protein phosphatase 2C domain-containing protein [Tannerella sp.]|jgi:protein phosphatase|nr:protein phosphatase 2C domain-containing protein [Tannerella sp.]